MNSKSILIILIFSICLNVFFFFKDKGSEHLIIASESQAKCLDNWKGVKQKQSIYGPEIFDGHFLISLKDEPKGTFEYEASGCFYDSISQSVSLNHLSSKVAHLKSQGFNEYYFYKSPNGNNDFDIYAKKSN